MRNRERGRDVHGRVIHRCAYVGAMRVAAGRVGVCRRGSVYVAAGRAWEGVCDHRSSLGQAVFIFSVLVGGYGKFEITLKKLVVTTRILLETEKVNFRAGIIF